MDSKIPSSQVPMQTLLCCAEKDPISSSSSSSSFSSLYFLSSKLMGIRPFVTPAKPPLPHAHHHGFRRTESFFPIILPIILTILLFAVVLLLVIFRRLRSGNNSSSNSNISSSSSSSSKNKRKLSKCSNSILNFHTGHDVRSCIYGSSVGFAPPTTATKFRGAQVFTYRELELACDKFSQENVIGNGGFGVVYRGVLTDGSVAAIKKLHRGGKQGDREFRVEVDLLCRLHSPYLLQLLGYCADQHHRLLVFEFMPNGNLQQHLHPNCQNVQAAPPLDWGTRLRIALDCARGLEYLHEHAVPTVIHRDFKCSNVLLDQNFRAKVSDFGLAKTGSDKLNGQVSTRVLGTTGYLAPEYASTGKLTTKSDVYSFGVVLLELITGRVPVDSKRPSGEHVLVSWALPRLTNREKVAEMVDPVLEGQYSKKELIQVAAIAAVCVQSEADYRPLITDVVQSLIPLVKHPATNNPTANTKFPHQTITIRSSSIDNGSSSTSTNSPHF